MKGGIQMIKILKKTVEIESNDTKNFKEKHLVLEYYLTENELDKESFARENVYGVEIIKKIKNGDGYIPEAESEYVVNISNNKNNVEDVLNKMINNTVTPVELLYVLDNILGV